MENFGFTEDQVGVREMAREFARERIAPMSSAMEEACELDQALLREMGELGYLGMTVPEKFGGIGLDLMSYILAMIEFAKADGSVAVTLSVHNSLACESLHRFGTPDQQERYLRRLAVGEIIGAFCLTEPDAGSDAASLTCAATKVDGGWKLDGSKIFVTNGGFAGLYLVFASTERSLRAKGITTFLVERGTPGLSVSKSEKKMGLKASSTVSLNFDSVMLPESQVLGEVNRGFSNAMTLLDGGRIGIAAQALGIAEAAFEAAVTYAKERKQFGQHLADFQAIRFKLANMAIELEAARQLIFSATRAKMANLPITREASIAKVFATEMAQRVTYEAIQIHGGYGFIADFPVERYFRDVRVTTLYEGTSEIQRVVISRDILK